VFHFESLGITLITSFGIDYLLSEFANYLFCVLLLILVTHLKLIDKRYFLFWCFYFLTPFFFNFVLFEPGYMGDQEEYIKQLVQLKTGAFIWNPQGWVLGEDTFNLFKTMRVGISLTFLQFIPMFSFSSVTGLAFTNKILLFILFIFLSKRIEPRWIILFLLIPSLILYTSVSLRDAVVIFFSVFSIIYLIEKKLLLSFIFIALVFLTKIQNGPGYLFLWVVLFVFQAEKSYSRIFFCLLLLAAGVIIFWDTLGPLLNIYRLAFAAEDGFGFRDVQALQIFSGFELILTSLKETFPFLLKPFPWQTSSPLQLVVFLETVALTVLFFVLFFRDKFYLNKTALIVILGFLLSMALHAITVSNLGTLARYRFITFFPFLLGLFYLRELTIKGNHEVKV